MTDERIPVIARVECRSESTAEEYPVAVWIGGKRLEIVEVIDRAVISSVEAGHPVRQRLRVEVADGTRCELDRILPEGSWKTYLNH
ncbi:MAG: hypothetical protein ACC742_09575 [Thermoanaerobaculales bacterium]